MVALGVAEGEADGDGEPDGEAERVGVGVGVGADSFCTSSTNFLFALAKYPENKERIIINIPSITRSVPLKFFSGI